MDEVSVIEAAYQVGADSRDWLDGLVQAAGPLLDEGMGVVALHVRLEANRVRLQSLSTLGGPPALREALEVFLRSCRPELLHRAFSRPGVQAFSSAFGGAEQLGDDPAVRPVFALGVRDSLRIVGADGEEQVAIANWRPRAMPPISALRAWRWTRIATHLSAGLRMRRALEKIQSPISGKLDLLADSEAILTPRGRIEHIEDAAKAATRKLVNAVVSVGAARGTLRVSDPDAALDAWRGLVDGRWSLIDHVDSDGKRFLLARKNAPGVPGPGGLTARERQVLFARARGRALKLVAYELGLSVATISRSMASGMAKLGIAEESELSAYFPA